MTPELSFAIQQLQSGNISDAIRLLDLVIRQAPENHTACLCMAEALKSIRNYRDAELFLRRAIAVRPDYTEALCNLAGLLNLQGRSFEAEACCRKALAINPCFPEALCNLGDALNDLGRLEEALSAYQLAVRHQPDFLPALNNMIVSLNAAGRYSEALRVSDHLVENACATSSVFINTGIALKALGRTKDAENAYLRAIDIEPGNAVAYSSLGNLLADQGQYEMAKAVFEKAVALQPDLHECRLRLALLLPPLNRETCPEQTEIMFEQQLAILENSTEPDEWARLGAVAGAVQPFSLAYRIGNHTKSLSYYGHIICKARAAWFLSRFGGLPAVSPVARHGRLKLLVVSGQISNHSVWNVILHGLLRHLDRSRFELVVYNTSRQHTAEADIAKTVADKYLHNAGDWTGCAVAEKPDCIFYPEIAMDPVAMQLASLKLAPLQAVGWGHPITSGLPTIDLFFSGELLEHQDADNDYSERLVRLPGTGACSIFPEVTAMTPDNISLNIPADRSITRFLICQQAAKLDPSFDSVYPRIASAAAMKCRFWFVRDNRHSWAELKLEERISDAFANHGLEASRYIRIIDWLPGEQFMGLLDCMDIYLDTPAFSGYTTAWKALHRGLPVVTLEGRFMRQRLAAGLLRRIGITATIAADTDDYILKATLLASEPGLRAELGRCLAKTAASLDEDISVIRMFEKNMLESYHLLVS